jgi:hypothetical protein
VFWLRVPAAVEFSDRFTAGGGGTTPLVIVNVREVREVVAAVAWDDGGGGTTLGASIPPEVRFAVEIFDGGGGTTFAAREFPAEREGEETLGGGGTTSRVPKISPIILLANDGLLVCVGGGGTTVGEDAATPLSRRRRSWAESAEGGGATTEGAGRLSFAFLTASRSGALTGGGTTETLVICTRVDGTSRPFAVGAGGTIEVWSAGAERKLAAAICVVAGAITFVESDGATIVRWREMFGAGAITLESKRGAMSGCADGVFGAGGTTDASRVGAVRDLSDETLGAGGTTEFRVRAVREWSRVTSSWAGAITFVAREGAVRVECNPLRDGTGSAEGTAGLDLNASRLATDSLEAGSFKLGASMTFSKSELPRAMWIVCERWCRSWPPERADFPESDPPRSWVRGSSSPE